MILALALQAALTFNLECTGVVGYETGQQHREDLTLRLDLEKRQWCPTYCAGTDPVIRFTDTEIVLIDQTFESGTVTYWSLNRQTGAYYNFMRNRRGVDFFWRRGTCEQRPFTGFGPDDPLNALKP